MVIHHIVFALERLPKSPNFRTVLLVLEVQKVEHSSGASNLYKYLFIQDGGNPFSFGCAGCAILDKHCTASLM